jgi:hypothetical protein
MPRDAEIPDQIVTSKVVVVPGAAAAARPRSRKLPPTSAHRYVEHSAVQRVVDLVADQLLARVLGEGGQLDFSGADQVAYECRDRIGLWRRDRHGRAPLRLEELDKSVYNRIEAGRPLLGEDKVVPGRPRVDQLPSDSHIIESAKRRVRWARFPIPATSIGCPGELVDLRHQRTYRLGRDDAAEPTMRLPRERWPGQ